MVDDLHAAEDLIGALKEAGYAVMREVPKGSPGSKHHAALLDLWSHLNTAKNYCRPTCRYLDALPDIEACDEACDDETCGCLCGHPGSKLDRS